MIDKETRLIEVISQALRGVDTCCLDDESDRARVTMALFTGLHSSGVLTDASETAPERWHRELSRIQSELSADADDAPGWWDDIIGELETIKKAIVKR